MPWIIGHESLSCIIVFLQVASSEWVLGVQIQHFENVYSSEIRNGLFCCCDDDGSLCKENIIDLQMCKLSATYNPCDTYFLVYVRDCLYNSTCNYTKYSQLNDDASLIQLVLPIPLEMELSENVRSGLLCTEIKLVMNICKHHFSSSTVTWKLCTSTCSYK